MLTILTIGGTSYDCGPNGRPGVAIFDMTATFSVEDEWSLAFSVHFCGPKLPFAPGQAVTLTTTNDDGTGSTLRFTGDLQRPEVRQDAGGLLWAYTCTDLKHRADRISVLGLDGSGVASFNLSTDDALYLPSLAGQTVGQILTQVLQAPGNAVPLIAAGFAITANSDGSYSLPPATVADLAALVVVPPEPIHIQGESLLNPLEALVNHYHPQYALWVLADGRIRVGSIFGFPVATVALPAADGTGDDVEWPDYVGPDTSNCYTSWTIQGLDIQPAYLSQVAGTLAPAWTSAQQGAWTLADYLQPKGSVDQGAITSITATSAVVQSDHGSVNWIANFWQRSQGWIYLQWPAGSGLTVFESRQITSCTAMSPGGSATITWDSSLPIDSTSYTRYKIVGENTPQALVGRVYDITEPGTQVGSPPYTTPAKGLQTFVGSHLYPRLPKGAWFGNNSQGEVQISYPAGVVLWSRGGAWPWFEVSIQVTVNQTSGQVILSEPAVAKSAGQAASGVLPYRYPKNYAEGLYYDLQICVPYNRGSLLARWPTSGEQGTAHTAYGITARKIQPLDGFTWIGDVANLTQLSRERLAVCQDAIFEGSTTFHGLPANFDPFTPGTALRFTLSGGSTPLDGLALPVRSCTISWPNDGPDVHRVAVRFSNLRRPFEGDSLYLPTAFAGAGGGGSNEVMIVGSIGGKSGTMSGDAYLEAAGDQRSETRMPSNALTSATSASPLSGPGMLTDTASNPLASTGNPLASTGNPLEIGSNALAQATGFGGEAGGGEGEGEGESAEMPEFEGPEPASRRRGPRQPRLSPRSNMTDAMASLAGHGPHQPPAAVDATAPPPPGRPIDVDRTPPAPRRMTLREKRGDGGSGPGTDDATGGGD